MSKSTRVVIVGAGASGLAAASRLVENGFDNVVILEASSRLGGRINSVDFNGNAIELGAQWIHGEEGNVALEMARDLVVDPKEETLEDLGEDFVDEEGQVWEEEEVDKMWEIVERVEEEEEDHEYSPQESMGDYYNNAIERLIKEEKKEFKVKMALFKDYYHRFYHSVDGCDNWFEDSFHGSVHQYQECEGNDMIPFREDKTFTDILTNFTKNIPHEAIKFNSEVELIERTESKVSATLKSGEKFEADYILVTLPLGVLKQNHASLFLPALPKSKVTAIEALNMGTVNKIFLEFDHVWWPTDSEGYAFLFENESNYTVAEAKVDWTRSILGLYRVLFREKILCAWVGGAGAREMENKSDEQVEKDLMGFLRKFLGKEYPQGIEQPKAIKVSRWFSNPLSRGSYSYMSVSTTKAGVTPEDLAKPTGRILFAGEATSSNHFSTVNGAIETGWREAERIINASVE